jgi:adenylyl- and sulfurtransferase ThiI
VLAIERPHYLSKTPEQKFWEIQIEEVKDGDRNIYFHYFNCPKKAENFSRQFNYRCFNVKNFFYSTVEKMRKRRGVKHF